MPNCGGIEIIYARFGGERAVAYLYAQWNGCLLPFFLRDALRYAVTKYRTQPAAVPHEVYRAFQRYQWAEAVLEPTVGLQHYRVELDLIAGEVRLAEDDSDRANPIFIESWTVEEFLALTDEEIEAGYHAENEMLPGGWAELEMKRTPFVLEFEYLKAAVAGVPYRPKAQRRRRTQTARARTRRTAETRH